MPIACMYFEATELAARCQQFQERLRLEHGLGGNLKLPPHLTIKAPFELPPLTFSQLRGRLQELIRRNRIIPIHAKVLAPSTFDIEGSGNKILHLPIESERLDDVLRLFIELFDQEFSIPQHGFEGESPHISLAREIPKFDVPGVISMARGFAWPESITLRHIAIVHKSTEQSAWRSGERLTLAG